LERRDTRLLQYYQSVYWRVGNALPARSERRYTVASQGAIPERDSCTVG
jgi:hypothetical protein